MPEIVKSVGLLLCIMSFYVLVGWDARKQRLSRAASPVAPSEIRYPCSRMRASQPERAEALIAEYEERRLRAVEDDPGFANLLDDERAQVVVAVEEDNKVMRAITEPPRRA